jgi:hypothetical protein
MTTSAVTPSSSTINLNDPRLTEEILTVNPEPDRLTAVIHGQIAPRYQSLRKHTREAVVTLAESWEFENAAQRLADCGRYGSVYKKCKKGNAAKAHRHTCHLLICMYCGQPHNLLHCWLRTRAPIVRTERQVGVEVIGPKDDMKKARKVAATLAQWFRRRGMSNVRRRVLEAHPTHSRVRFVLQAAQLPYRDTLDQLRKIAGVGWSIQPYREIDPMRVLKWMFASTESLLTDVCGHTAARVLMRNDGDRLMATAGDFYRECDTPTPANEPDPETHENDPTKEFSDPASLCTCGECDGVMEDVPFGQRTTETVDEINEKYPLGVDWSGCHDPFKVRRKQAHTSNFARGYRDPSTASAEAPSPPV